MWQFEKVDPHRKTHNIIKRSYEYLGIPGMMPEKYQNIQATI